MSKSAWKGLCALRGLHGLAQSHALGTGYQQVYLAGVELQEGSIFISQGACPHELVPHLAPLINTLILLKGKG